jgi:hypothetical protein
MAFGPAGAAKERTHPLGPEWQAQTTASRNKPSAIFGICPHKVAGVISEP